MAKFFVAIIRLYQVAMSPWLGSNCRFYPSCSQYAQEALAQHGVGPGAWLLLKRIGRCHPWHEGGVDLVPPSNKLVEKVE